MNPALKNLLEDCDEQFVSYALGLCDRDTFIAAEWDDLIEIRYSGEPVDARWALTSASPVERSHNLTVHLTRAGRDHLRSAR